MDAARGEVESGAGERREEFLETDSVRASCCCGELEKISYLCPSVLSASPARIVRYGGRYRRRKPCERTPAVVPCFTICSPAASGPTFSSMKQWIADYIQAQKAALDSIPVAAVEQVIQRLCTVWKEDRQVFVAGNGGSASNSSHFITDLGKGASDKLPKRFRCLSLTDNVSWITALGNDYSYADVFVGQLQNFARKGDLFIGVSVSGSSPNLVKAMEWCRQNGVETIALVGAKKGKMAELGDHVLVTDSVHYGRVEDAQMGILHMLCYAFIERPEMVK